LAHTLTDDVLPALADALSERLPAALGWMGLAALLLGLAVVVEPRIGRGWLRRTVLGVLVALSVGWGLSLAWQRLWLCDDAYISFRYAENLAQGHGLVFNVGEWVEGYTNFLWTALLGGLGFLGLDIPYTALALNLLSFGLAVLFTALTVARNSPKPLMIPFAALALGASWGFTTFASSGLETMPAAALVVAGMLASGRPWLSGTLLILAALARPDHLLFWGAMGLALASEDLLYGAGPWLRRLRWRRYLAFTAPLVLLFVPWFLLRWVAYGELFPNTYYAKSGGGAYYAQGLVYLAVWLATSGAWLWLPLFGLLALARPRSPAELRLRVFALVGVLVYGHYVVKVGGDFMLERFFIVLWPVVLISLELSLRFTLQNGGLRRLWLLPALPALGFAATAIRPIPEGKKIWHLADEPSFYRIERLAPLKIRSRYPVYGRALAEAFGHMPDPPRIASGSIGLLGYYSKLPISDRYGLINKQVAHRPITVRGRPGHEKEATLQDLLDDGAELSLHHIWGEHRRRWTEVQVGAERFHLVRDLPRVRTAFAGSSRVRMPPRPTGAVQRATTMLRREDALEEWRFLKEFVRDLKDLAPLVARLGAVADFEEGLPAGLQIEGDAPGWHDTEPPKGASGKAWLELDGPGTRRLVLPVDLGSALELRFALGGSALPGHRVELWSRGRRLFVASPRGGRVLYPEAFVFHAPIGTGELVVVDEETGSGTMLLLDGVHVPGPGDVRQRLATPGLSAQRIGELLPVAAEELPAQDPGLKALLGQILALHWDFEQWPADLTVEGTAFGSGPTRGALPTQQPIRDPVGGFLNSFHGGDDALGVVRSAPFTVPAQGIGLRVAGGKNCQQVYVGLEVDGQIVDRVCGANDERFRLRVLPARTYAGRTGRLVIVDQAQGPWGHLLVDDVVVPRATDHAAEDPPPLPADDDAPQPAPRDDWGTEP